MPGRSVGRQTVGRLAERRRNQRVPSNGRAFAKLIHPTVSERFSIRILDVSKDGLKIDSPHLLEAGSTLQLFTDRVIAIAEVRYCIRAGEGYHVGVFVQDSIAKSGSGV